MTIIEDIYTIKVKQKKIPQSFPSNMLRLYKAFRHVENVFIQGLFLLHNQ